MPTLPTDTFDTLKEIGMESKETQQLLISLYIEDTPLLIQNIENMAQKQDADATKKAAHTLKGSCLNLGFYVMGDICKEIETLALSGQFQESLAHINTLKETHTTLAERLKAL